MLYLLVNKCIVILYIFSWCNFEKKHIVQLSYSSPKLHAIVDLEATLHITFGWIHISHIYLFILS